MSKEVALAKSIADMIEDEVQHNGAFDIPFPILTELQAVAKMFTETSITLKHIKRYLASLDDAVVELNQERFQKLDDLAADPEQFAEHLWDDSATCLKTNMLLTNGVEVIIRMIVHEVEADELAAGKKLELRA